MCGGVVGDFVEDVTDTVSDAGAGLDDFVNDSVPGGWATVALAAAGAYYAPEIGAYVSGEGAVLGATEAEAAATLGATAETAGAAAGTTGAATTAGAATTGGAAAAGAGAAGGGITLGQVGSALTIAAGVNSLTGGAITNAITGGNDTRVNTGGGTGGGNDGGGGGGGGGGGNEDVSTPAGALKVADPFSPYRAKLAEMYSGYLTGGDKTDITKMPGYSQFESGVLNPALEATKRAGAKSGMLMSGNEQIALQKQGQTGYYGFMTDYLNRLATGSGATTSPYNAANLATNQANTTNTATSQGVGAVLTGVGGLLGSNAVSGTNLSNLFGFNNAPSWTTGTDVIPETTFNGSGDASWMSDWWMN